MSVVFLWHLFERYNGNRQVLYPGFQLAIFLLHIQQLRMRLHHLPFQLQDPALFSPKLPASPPPTRIAGQAEHHQYEQYIQGMVKVNYHNGTFK